MLHKEASQKKVKVLFSLQPRPAHRTYGSSLAPSKCLSVTRPKGQPVPPLREYGPTNFSWRKMALMLIYQSNISIGSASQTVPPDHVMTKVPGFWRPLNKRIIRENPFLRNKTALMSTPVYLAMKRKFP